MKNSKEWIYYYIEEPIIAMMHPRRRITNARKEELVALGSSLQFVRVAVIVSKVARAMAGL